MYGTICDLLKSIIHVIFMRGQLFSNISSDSLFEVDELSIILIRYHLRANIYCVCVRVPFFNVIYVKKIDQQIADVRTSISPLYRNDVYYCYNHMVVLGDLST